MVQHLVDPAHHVEDLVAPETGHVAAGDDLDLSFAVDDPQLRQNREGLQPNGEAPEVLECMELIARANVEQDREQKDGQVDEQVVVQVIQFRVVA